MPEQDKQIITLKAAGDLSASQYEAMKMSAPLTVTVCSATTDSCIGILQNDPNAANEAAELGIGGRLKAKVGATVADGDRLGPAADGALDPVTADQLDWCAIALDDGADGDIIDVLFYGSHERSTA